VSSRVLVAVPLVLCLAGCPSADDDDVTPAPAFDEDLTGEVLEALQDELIEQPAHGCTVALTRGDGAAWTAGAGLDGPDGDPLVADAPMGVASITKTYTAGLILELVDSGDLALDDSLQAWMPGVHPRGADITVEMLLRHTAGVPGALGLPETQGDVTRAWTEDELFALVADEPLLHEPGTDYSYSNTHFMLLARIAQAADGTPWRTMMEERLFAPFGLSATRVPALGEGWGDLTPSWFGDDPFPEDYRTHPESAGGAGNIVSTALDVASWGQARFGGGLHSAELTSRQAEGDQIAPGIDYGLGAMVLDTAGGDDIGHNGILGGFATWVGYRPDADVTLALLCNAWGSNPTNAGYPLGLAQDALWEVMQ
jgi:D-alanyl-D-alanine carboxypeptidase